GTVEGQSAPRHFADAEDFLLAIRRWTTLRADVRCQRKRLPRERMRTKERPTLPRGVHAAARGPGEPFRHRPAARPGVAASMDGVEHHVRVLRTARVLEAGDVSRDPGFDRA